MAREHTKEQQYLNETFGIIDSDLEKIRERLKAGNADFMSVSPFEAKLLQFLIRTFKVEKIVEIGALFGYSAVAMAKALPPSGKIYSIEKSEQNYKELLITDDAVECREQIDFILGDALDELADLQEQGPFDMVFIDANKGGYVEYLNWAEQNVKKGGLIVGDNTFLFGGVYGESRDPQMGPKQVQVMQEFNRRLADPVKYNSILIPTFEGMTVAQKLY